MAPVNIREAVCERHRVMEEVPDRRRLTRLSAFLPVAGGRLTAGRGLDHATTKRSGRRYGHHVSHAMGAVQRSERRRPKPATSTLPQARKS